MRLAGPVLYDFRRALVMKTTIILLVVFVAGGAGLSLLAYQSFTMQYPPVNGVVVVKLCNGTGEAKGILLDPMARPLREARLTVAGWANSSWRVSGVFQLTGKSLYQALQGLTGAKPSSMTGWGKGAPRLVVESLTGRAELGLRLFYQANCGGRGEGVVAVFTNTFNQLVAPVQAPIPQLLPGTGAPRGNPGIVAGYYLALLDKRTGEAVLVAYALNASSLEPVNATLEYNTSSTGLLAGPSTGLGALGNYSFQVLGPLQGFPATYHLRLDPHSNLLVLRLRAGSRELIGVTSYGFLPPLKAGFTSILLDASSRVFSEFFPIAFLYLAYVFMARPRSNGALEFILARPVTRLDVYATRYLAGVLLALTAPLLFTIALYASIAVIAGPGAVEPGVLLLLYTGMAVSMAAFYSLCYGLAANTKSTSYLVAAIILYLLFSMFWGMLALVYTMATGAGFQGYQDAVHLLDYFNPLGAASFASYYAQLELGLTAESRVVNPVAAAIAATLWILVPLITGYLVFRKTDL